MKRLLFGLTIMSMLSIISCTTITQTHKQVMDKYQTKDEVFTKFGTPTEKIMSASSEEWIYDYAKKASVKTKDKGNEKESGDGVFNFSDDNTNTTKMSYFNESKRY